MSNIISKELLSEVLCRYIYERDYKNIGCYANSIRYWESPNMQQMPNIINIYELAHRNLKEWAKINNVFDIIDWSGEPEQIFAKAEELKNELEKNYNNGEL